MNRRYFAALPAADATDRFRRLAPRLLDYPNLPTPMTEAILDAVTAVGLRLDPLQLAAPAGSVLTPAR